jgi:hypothetical protein
VISIWKSRQTKEQQQRKEEKAKQHNLTFTLPLQTEELIRLIEENSTIDGK